MAVINDMAVLAIRMPMDLLTFSNVKR